MLGRNRIDPCVSRRHRYCSASLQCEWICSLWYRDSGSQEISIRWSVAVLAMVYYMFHTLSGRPCLSRLWRGLPIVIVSSSLISTAWLISDFFARCWVRLTSSYALSRSRLSWLENSLFMGEKINHWLNFDPSRLFGTRIKSVATLSSVIWMTISCEYALFIFVSDKRMSWRKLVTQDSGNVVLHIGNVCFCYYFSRWVLVWIFWV